MTLLRLDDLDAGAVQAVLAARSLAFHDLADTPRAGWLDAVETLVVEALRPPQLELL